MTPEQIQALRDIPLSTLVRPNRLAIAFAISGKSQGEASEATGISQSRLSAIVTGKRPAASADEAHLLAQFFGCDSLDLFPLAKEAQVA